MRWFFPKYMTLPHTFNAGCCVPRFISHSFGLQLRNCCVCRQEVPPSSRDIFPTSRLAGAAVPRPLLAEEPTSRHFAVCVSSILEVVLDDRNPTMVQRAALSGTCQPPDFRILPELSSNVVVNKDLNSRKATSYEIATLSRKKEAEV